MLEIKTMLSHTDIMRKQYLFFLAWKEIGSRNNNLSARYHYVVTPMNQTLI
jgi:hypothetical protein